ncbi:MAG: DciA family protein [Rhodospirillales bacterium]
MAGTSAASSPSTRSARSRGLRALAETVDRLTAPLIGTQRLLAADLMLDWATIAGDRLAAVSCLDRLVFPPKQRSGGTLHLRVAPGGAALEVQHDARRLIDRINVHLGYPAVARLKVLQAPLPPRSPARPPASPPHPPAPASPPSHTSEAAEASAGAGFDAAVLAGIEDDRLRHALARLGRRLAADAGDADRPEPPADACPGVDKLL